jgi:hypothetical protein
MRIPTYPRDEAIEAVDMLASLRWRHEEGDPVGSELADDALDEAAYLPLKYGLLDLLINRASRLQTW